MNSLDWKVMVRGASAALLVTGLLVAGLPQAAWAQLPTATPTPPVDPAFATPEPAAAALPAFAPGELLVGVRTGVAPAGASVAAAEFTSADAMAVTVAASGAQVAEIIDATGPADGQVTYLLQTEPGQEYAVANELLGKPGVVYVEPNWYVTVAQDPDYAATTADTNSIDVSPGYVVNDPLYAANQWNMQRINAARAWQMIFVQSLFTVTAEVTVALLDTGIDTTHPDFAGRLLPGYNYIGTGNPPMRDGYGHGTHVAGILAAGLNDGVGVAGVAPTIKIAPYRVLGDDGSGTIASVVAGIVDAADSGARIINMSLTTTSASSTLKDAVVYAAGKGALLLAAAGNGSTGTVYWPAAYPEVMAVAALDYNDHRTSYSNFGPQIEISAPGGDLTLYKVFSTWSADAIARCAAPVYSGGAAYCTRSGTSQATPAVAGAAALLLSIKPSLTAADVRALLRDAADPLNEVAQYVGAGKLNVANALREILPSTVDIVASAFVTEVRAVDLPMTITVALQNPSLEAIDFSAALNVPLAAGVSPTATQGAWITMTSGLNDVQVGTLTYGEPDYVTLLISPTKAISGTYVADLSVSGTRGDGTTVDEALPLRILITIDPTAAPGTPEPPAATVTPVPPGATATPQPPLPSASDKPVKLYLPAIRGGSLPTDTIAAGNLEWLAPAAENTRITYTLTDTGAVTLTLPAAIRIGAQQFAAARIHADGFVALGNSSADLAPLATTPLGENRCIPALAYPAQGVFGWWADLDPSAAGARVSSFVTSDGRVVIEFKDVPATAVAQTYEVSFQIVLATDGSVGLNFEETPSFIGRPENVTVGVEGQDALVYSLFGCVTPTTTLGALPRSGESYLIQPLDIY